jgi:hypothetical protein
MGDAAGSSATERNTYLFLSHSLISKYLIYKGGV